jgi:hypothetical protein
VTEWTDVTVAIPTVPERAASWHRVASDALRACPGALLVVQQHQPGTLPRVDFPIALGAAGRVGRPWILQLEDDVVLAPNFGACVLPWLDDCDVLTLFSRNGADLEAMYRGESVRRMGPSSFSMSQGFLIRSELAVGIEAFAPTWYAAHPEHNRAADLLLAAYLSERKARVLVRVPSLVQHLRGPSTLPNHRGARQSESFRRAFGEVP